MDKIFGFLSQQSTWKGILGLSTAIGLVLSPEQSAAITAAGLAAVGLINVFRNEKKVG